MREASTSKRNDVAVPDVPVIDELSGHVVINLHGALGRKVLFRLILLLALMWNRAFRHAGRADAPSVRVEGTSRSRAPQLPCPPRGRRCRRSLLGRQWFWLHRAPGNDEFARGEWPKLLFRLRTAVQVLLPDVAWARCRFRLGHSRLPLPGAKRPAPDLLPEDAATVTAVATHERTPR